MKKDDFFSQYQYEHELDARLKNRQERMWLYGKKVLIFSIAAVIIPLFFGKKSLSAILFLIAFIFSLLYAGVYVFWAAMIRPRCKKCGKRMLKKYIATGCGGEEQLYFHCPDCRIYSEAYISRD